MLVFIITMAIAVILCLIFENNLIIFEDKCIEYLRKKWTKK